MITTNPEAVARFERAAATNPAAYKRRVVITAIAGDVVLTALQLLPFALMIGIPLLFFRHPLFYWTAAFVMVFVIWLTRPTYRVTGREILPAEAPLLFAALDDVRNKLKVGGKMRVMIDDSFNASAGESRGLFGLFGTTRALTLGMPLLVTLTREQIIAVIAHELGHFSRRHGRFGHWLYRARAGWMMYLDDTDDDDAVLSKAIAWYGKAFVPHFSALSFVHSRQCEYEADADAASVVGPVRFAESLRRVAVQSEFWDEELTRKILHWRREHADAPENFYEKAARASIEWERAEGVNALTKAFQRSAGYTNTHPSLTQRQSALGIADNHLGVDEHAEMGGAALFGDAWKTLMSEFNAAWRRREQPGWASGYFYHQHIGKTLLDAGVAEVDTWNATTALARVRAMRIGEPQRALAEISILSSRFPDDHDISFLLAQMLVDSGNDDGIAAFEKLWPDAPIYRVRIAPILADHFVNIGDAKRSEEWSAKMRLAFRTRSSAIEKALREAESGHGKQGELASSQQTYLSDLMSHDAGVVGAWLYLSTQTLIENRAPQSNVLAIHTLWLRFDINVLQSGKIDEDDLRNCYANAVARLFPLSDEVIVRTFFTTENIPAALDGALKLFAREN